MIKVLIADDELLVRIGLKSTIPWEENGFLVVGEAKNGKEAVELFEEFDPDILLTDIRMPIMNGLELIQKLKERKNSLKAVILTHYDDFNYAKEAIKLGASEYILKSDLSQENLLGVLKKLSSEIASPADGRRTNLIQSAQKVNDADRLEELFKRTITGDFKIKQELAGLLNKGKSHFKQGLFIVAAAEVYTNEINEAVSAAEVENYKKSIENVSNQVFLDSSVCCILDFYKNELLFLFTAEEQQDLNNTADKVKNYLDLVKKNVMQFLDLDMSVGISPVGVSFEKVSELLEKARIARNYCFFETSGMMVYNACLDNSSEAECPKINLELLKDYVKTFEQEQLERYIHCVFDEMLVLRNLTYVREVFIDFLSFARIIAAELNLKNKPAFNEQKFSYRNFDKLHSFEMVRKYIMDIYHELMHQTDGGGKLGKYSFTISKCIDYIRNNYHKNISLADTADYVDISKSYLSLLFKQETGINFSSYLTNYRIEKSKKLLRESNYKIYEIAEKVGFDNPYYFSKVFKEVTGNSCKEFKKA